MIKIILTVGICTSVIIGAEEVYLGETYRIVEPNPIIEIRKNITENRDKIEKKAQKYRADSKKKLEEMENRFDPGLTPAQEDRIWKIDTTYVLQYDIPDGKGGILFHKGYKFDPKDYIRLTKNLVVLDGSSKRELQWAIDKQLIRNRHFKILITKGKIVKVMRTLGGPVYYYTEEVHRRFKLKHTPTIVRQGLDKALYAYEFKIDVKEK